MRGEPEPEPVPVPVNSVELALRLLLAIAENPKVCGSHRIAARRHFRRLERMVEEERRGPRGEAAGRVAQTASRGAARLTGLRIGGRLSGSVRGRSDVGGRVAELPRSRAWKAAGDRGGALIVPRAGRRRSRPKKGYDAR